MQKFLVVRHAEGQHQEEGLDVKGYLNEKDFTPSTAPLTELGMRQADHSGGIVYKYVQENIQTQGFFGKKVYFFSSTMKRAVETLDYIARGEEGDDFIRTEDARLCEVNHNVMDWMGRVNYKNVLPEADLGRLWHLDPYHTRTISGTCPADMEVALRSFLSDLDKIKDACGLFVLVSHGRTLQILESLLSNKSNKADSYAQSRVDSFENAEVREWTVDRFTFPTFFSSRKIT
jgi:broad specificity phosphatase PhoE